MKKRIIAAALFILLCVSCSTNLNQAVVSPGMAKKQILRGTSTQANIFEFFGAPNFVTTTKKGGELWVYSNYATMNKGLSLNLGALGGGSGIIGGGIGGGNLNATSSRSVTLMITFDKNDVVTDYTVSQLQY